MNGILKVLLGIYCGNTKANGPMTGGDLKGYHPSHIVSATILSCLAI